MKKNISVILMTFFLMATTSGCATSRGSGGIQTSLEAKVLDKVAFSADPTGEAAKMTKYFGGGNFGKNVFEGTKKVFIPLTNIEVITESGAKFSAGGFALSSYGETTVKVETKLTNVDEALLRSVAKDAYDSLVKQLESAGLEVVPLNTVHKASEWSKLVEKAQSENPVQRDELGFSPRSSVVADGTLFIATGDFSGFPPNAPNWIVARMGKELNAIPLSLTMTVDFSKFTGSGGQLSREATVETKAVLQIQGANLSFYHGDGYGGLNSMTVALESDEEFASVEKVSTADNKDAKALAKGLSFLGGGRNNQSDISKTVYNIVADQARYRKAMKGLSDQVSLVLVSRLKGEGWGK